MKTLDMADDVIAGSSAFAGLIIVYVGAAAAAFDGYDAEAQGAVKEKLLCKAKFGAAGVGIAALAAIFAVLGKWASYAPAVGFSVFLLVITLLWGFGIAVATVREID